MAPSVSGPEEQPLIGELDCVGTLRLRCGEDGIAPQRLHDHMVEREEPVCGSADANGAGVGVLYAEEPSEPVKDDISPLKEVTQCPIEGEILRGADM